MSEIINDKKVFSLLEVCLSVENTLKQRYTRGFWVKAEMNKLNFYKHSGHCYPDLLEKKNGKILAQMRAILWSKDYQNINKKFIDVIKEPLKEGINIMFYATIEYNPSYGLSLRIFDIDPIFTLGDLEKEKAESINELKRLELFDKNKQLTLPLLPKRIAIISVDTSKGYADFKKVIEQNQWGYNFFTMLFPALLQGDKAVKSITAQLENIKKVKHHFDVVAIIRGGGGEVGLTCYNHLDLAKKIAAFPLPVLTGIGHSTNMTVTEMVAFKNAITPTEIADFLIQKFHDFSVPLQKLKDQLIANSLTNVGNNKKLYKETILHLKSNAKYHLNQSKLKLSNETRFLINNVNNDLKNNKLLVERSSNVLEKSAVQNIQNQKENMLNLEAKVRILDPKNILKRGFTISKINGKSVQDLDLISEGEKLETITSKGTIFSTIKNINKDEQED